MECERKKRKISAGEKKRGKKENCGAEGKKNDTNEKNISTMKNQIQMYN